MERYLDLMFYWEGSLEDLEEYLRQRDQSRFMVQFMSEVLTNADRRRQAEIYIMDSLHVFEQEAGCLNMFLTDPLLVDRFVLVLNRMLGFVPRNAWVRGKILLDRLRHIARSTRFTRSAIALAHLRQPLKMSGRLPATRSSLNLLN